MNITPIYEYIANQLNTAVSLYAKESGLFKQFRQDDNSIDFFTPQPLLLHYLLEKAVADYPIFSFINEHICYIHFVISDGTVIIGPFHMLFSENNAHARHILTLEEIAAQSLPSIPSVYPPHALRYALLLFNCYQSQNLTESECYQKNFQTEYIRVKANTQTTADIFSNRENQKMHNPYTQELRLLKSIEDGDIEMLQKIWSEPVPGNLGTTARDPVRNGKNMAIYNVTACGRAAIRGGLSAEYVFSLTDSYTQQIEELKNMLVLQSLVEDAEMNFAQMVAELKRNRSKTMITEHPLIHRCKDYVFQHLHSPLTVQEIAEALRVHPNYLSSLFHSQEGESLYQYILLKKIDLTKNLLTYSDYSYLDIANYLGFTSQSHLGTRFKAITGMTLKKYRDTYKKEEFFN